MVEKSHDENQMFLRLSPSITKIKPECIYLNPLANNHYVPSSPPPIIPPKSTVRHIQPVLSASPIHVDVENNVIPTVAALQIDSPDSSKFTVVQEGSWWVWSLKASEHNNIILIKLQIAILGNLTKKKWRATRYPTFINILKNIEFDSSNRIRKINCVSACSLLFYIWRKTW